MKTKSYSASITGLIAALFILKTLLNFFLQSGQWFDTVAQSIMQL